ncbi:hypothetical protein [Botrimarina mediterranea]
MPNSSSSENGLKRGRVGGGDFGFATGGADGVRLEDAEAAGGFGGGV